MCILLCAANDVINDDDDDDDDDIKTNQYRHRRFLMKTAAY